MQVTAADELCVTLGYAAVTSPQCGAGYTFLQQDMDIDGANLNPAGHGDDPIDCCALCSRSPSCDGFAWLAGACYLKANVTKFVPKVGVVSARRRQGVISASSASNSPPSTPPLTFPIVRGGVFITALFDSSGMNSDSGGGRGLTPVVELEGYTLVSINGQQPVPPSAAPPVALHLSAATQWVLELAGTGGWNATWVLFAQNPITFSATTTKLQALAGGGAQQGYTGWLRIAAVPPSDAGSQALVDVLAKHSSSIAVSSAVDFGIRPISSGEEGIVSYSYSTLKGGGGATSLLLLAPPHHIAQATPGSLTPVLIGSTPVQVVYNTTLGLLTLVTARVGGAAVATTITAAAATAAADADGGIGWQLALPLTNITWEAPHGMWNCTQKDAVADALSDLEYLDPGPFAGRNSSIYWYDKGLWKAARLALIADELGAPDIAATLRLTLKSRLEPLLTGQTANSFVYEPVWGGVVAHDSLLSSWIDFGAGQYNDHHFHWGYILNSAAAVARKDPEWGKRLLPHLLDLIRDIANPVRTDPHFPPHRHLDFWAGHSWASGTGGGAKNQESSSEAVNAYYGMALLGEALGDAGTHLRDLGRLFLQIEIEGAKWYWHISSARPQVYPTPSAFSDRKCVGRRFA